MMKSRFKWLISISILLLLGIIILVPRIYTLCVDVGISQNDFFEAKIYDNAQYDLGGPGLQLTEQGVDVTAWNYNNSKYLKVTTNVPQDDGSSNFIIGITLPREFYFSVNKFLLPTGCSKVEFEKNNDFTVNTNYTYQVNKHSGTVYYTVNPGVRTITIQLEIKYDFELWNKLGNSLINQKDEKSIVVKLYNKQTEMKEILKKSVNNVYSENRYNMTSGLITYINDERNQNKQIKLLYSNRNKEIIRYRYFLIPKTQNVIKTYFKELRFKIKLPEYVDKNKVKHYMTIDKSTLDFRLQTSGIPEYTIDESDINNGNIILTYKNVYFSTEWEILLWYNLKVPEIDGLDNDSVLNFSAIETQACVVDNVGGENWITGTSAYNISFFMQAKENVDIRAYYREVSYRAGSEKNIAYFGGMFLYNSGTGDSNKKHVDILFDVENSGYMQVTAMNLPIYQGVKTYDIKYRLVDENNIPIYKDESGNYVADNTRGKNYEFSITLNWTVSNGKKLMFNRNLLPEKERKYFFKEIKYDIEKIKAGNVLYEPSSIGHYNSVGNYFGYANYQKNEESVIHSKFTIRSEGFSDIEHLERTYFKKNSFTPYSVTNMVINGKSANAEVIAGNSLNIGGEVQISYYPYGNLHWINNIVLGFVLPDGVSIKEDSVVLSTKKDKIIKAERVETVDLYNGNKLWKIHVPADVMIGFANEELDTINSGRSLKFESVINIDANVEGQTLNLNKVFYVTTRKTDKFAPIYNGASGAYEWAKKVDKYDLNGDGKTDDIIGGANDSHKLSFKIIPQTDFFTINDSISVNSGPFSKKVEMAKRDDLLNYKLHLKFNENASFDNFKYYIPIPKKNSATDKYLIKSKDDFYDLVLDSKVELPDNDIYKIYYTTKKGVNIDNAETVDWLEENQIANFNDVTMIKITQKKLGLMSGSDTELNVKLRYLGNDFEKEFGNKIEFHSAGNLRYVINGNATEGIFGTNGVTIDAKGVKELPDITLTAAPNRIPLISNNSNFNIDYMGRFSYWSKLHKLKIVNVETNNVELKTKEEINSNLDVDSTVANKTFAIRLKVDDEDFCDILSNKDYSNLRKELTLGKGSYTAWQYDIYNANNLSDDITNRYIIITYQSDNGLTLKQKIIINRELKAAENPISSVVAGQRYRLFDDDDSDVTLIKKKSACTAQFVLNYVPNFYNQKKLKLDKKLPVGTKITFYDYVKKENLTYWYYRVENETDTINIADFKKMGYTSQKYNNLDEGNYIKEVYMMTFDFKDVKNNTLNEIKAKIEMDSLKVEKYVTAEIDIRIEDDYIFDLNGIPDKIDIGDKINLDYNVNLNGSGINTYFENKRLAYVITFEDEMPDDTSLVIGDKATTSELNSRNQCIIYAKNVNEEPVKKTFFKLEFKSKLKKSKYNVKIDLMLSGADDYDQPFMGDILATKNVVVENKIIENPSLKIIDLIKRVLSKSDLKNNQLLKLKYLKENNFTISLELQKKVGNDYNLVSDKLISVAGKTDNVDGVFNIDLNNGDNDLRLKFSESMNTGTYRLLIKVKKSNGSIIYEIPYSFIVRDDIKDD